MEISLEPWILATFMLMYSIHSIIQGWQMYKYKKKSLLLIESASLWLLEILRGEEVAKKRKDELLTPTRIYRMGIYRIDLQANSATKPSSVSTTSMRAGTTVILTAGPVLIRLYLTIITHLIGIATSL